MIDRAFTVLRRFGWPLLRATFLPSLALSGAWVFLQRYVFPGLTSTRQETNLSGQIAESVGTILVACLVGLPLATFGWAACQNLAAIFAHEGLLGRPSDPRELRRRAWARAPAAFSVALVVAGKSLVGMAIALGTMIAGALATSVTDRSNALPGVLAAIGIAGLVAGFLLMIWILSDGAFAIPVSAVEGGSGMEARRRSKLLLAGGPYQPNGLGSIWGIYGAGVAVWLVAYVGVGIGWDALGLGEMIRGTVVHLPLGAVLAAIVEAVPTVLIVWIVQAFVCTAVAVQYVERRVRMEGLDIAALAEEARRGARALD